ncbi:amidase [Streptomyces chartreusis]|uniref:Amidase n=1 Tax=Streptomyces chartreusis TaxID=1969 RepID=A0A7I0NSV5_STRCX|nr:amidase [Streptomyces chartreusis]QKZ16148.1 amidase [Streptomyces chartreusis]
MSDDLWRWSADRTARSIREGEVSAVEVVSAAMARLEETNPATNAFGEIAEDALDRAKEADEAAARGEDLGFLHGVPTALKLNTNVVGKPTPDGVGAYLGYRAAETAPVLTNLLGSGAISVGRTNCPPFSTRWTTESTHFGVTRNPWDPAVTPGGSSGGAAAAVASGVVSIAHGNDIGGSIRYPAAVCGVVGIRPTVGRVPGWHSAPNAGTPLCAQQFAVEGVIARTITDLRLGLRAVEGADPRDPLAVPLEHIAPRDADTPVRVAVVTNPGSHPLAGPGQPETDAAVRTAAEWLADAGYAVEEVELPQLGDAATLWWQLALTEFKTIGVVDEVHRVGDAGIRVFFDLMYSVYSDVFGEVAFADYLLAHNKRVLLQRQVSEFMARYPIVLVPNSGEPAFQLGDDIASAERTRELMTHQWSNMAVPTLGLPGLGIPVTPTAGAPLGVQLIGRAFDEERLFRAGEVIEQRSGIRTPIDPRVS